jgi:tetratricopeptide (TPR) repeat protein
MAFDPYDPCPCGSGKKFKWCCQPIYMPISKAFEQFEAGQYDAALRALDEVVAQHPNNPEAHGRKAQLLWNVERADEAEASLDKALALNPNYPFGHYLRGRFRYQEGEVPGALLLFRKAAALYDPEAHDHLGQLHALIAECELKLNRPVAARAALQVALRHQPSMENVQQALDEVFGPKAQFPESACREYSFLALPADTPADRRAAWKRALQTAGSGKLADARQAFEELTGSDPDSAAAWYNLGLSRAWLGDNSAAIEALDRYVALETDESKAAAAWCLAGVLRQGIGMEDQSDYVSHAASAQIRNIQQFVSVLEGLQREKRFFPTASRPEEGLITGLILEKVQALTPERQTELSPHVGAYVMILADFLELWHTDADAVVKVQEEVRQRAGLALGDPHWQQRAAAFTQLLTEGTVVPLGATSEEDAKRRYTEALTQYLEEQWIHRPLKALSGTPPIDAAGHGTLRRKVLGVVQLLEECARLSDMTYDFDRLRRKLGLLGAPAVAAALAISDMGAPELAALAVEQLADADLEQAYQAALRLDARELAGHFARALVGRPPRPERPDRYPVYRQLIQQALTDGDTDAALKYVSEGEKADGEHNEGRRRNDYELRRGQIHLKRGEMEPAQQVFEGLLARVPTDLQLCGSAAEAMLSARQGSRALRFAEQGLSEARKQNNRDSEQHFLELTAAARKQGA